MNRNLTPDYFEQACLKCHRVCFSKYDLETHGCEDALPTLQSRDNKATDAVTTPTKTGAFHWLYETSEADAINELLEEMRTHHNQRMDNMALSAPPFYKRKVDVTPIVRAVVKGFDYDPGHSDLDDEQPVSIQMTLGDYRRARRLLYDLEDLDEKRLDQLQRESGCSDAEE